MEARSTQQTEWCLRQDTYTMQITQGSEKGLWSSHLRLWNSFPWPDIMRMSFSQDLTLDFHILIMFFSHRADFLLSPHSSDIMVLDVVCYSAVFSDVPDCLRVFYLTLWVFAIYSTAVNSSISFWHLNNFLGLHPWSSSLVYIDLK